MAVRTVTFLPVDDLMAQSIVSWLSLSDGEGGPLPLKTREWLDAALKVAKGLRLALADDGVIEAGL